MIVLYAFMKYKAIFGPFFFKKKSCSFVLIILPLARYI